MSQSGTLLCFAHGDDRAWEAHCVDLDIAVQGRTFEEVREQLDAAVHSYVQDALAEDEMNRQRLLSRRAPWYVTLGLTLRLIAYNAMRGSRREAQAIFPVACHA